MRKTLLAGLLSVGLLMPVLAAAQDRDDHHDRDRDRDRDRDGRYYDRDHKDYHRWDDHEDRAWRIYWQQRHHDYVGWDRAEDRDRRSYWAWRHDHPDSVLQINVR